MLNLLLQKHKPDILDCIANLSNDEVFTSPTVANKVLDLLPSNVWTDPTLRFLDPFTKSGIFLREAAKRLMVGLESAIPDENLRREHIFKHMLHGIAITELTAQISRRTLYYSKDASSEKSVVKLDTPDGNIHYKNIAHTFKNDFCIHCGAPTSFARDLSSQESHAYLFIHEEMESTMKFDVIIGNPPYQLKDGGHGASASPIYQKFVQKAIDLNPKYISMIIPSRWFAGGKGLDEFRKQMLNDSRIKTLVDHANANDCFPGVEIEGGVCYFLWDQNHGKLDTDKCTVRNIMEKNSHDTERKLNDYDVFIRFNQAVSILEKVRALNEPALDTVVSSRKPFGFATNFDNYQKDAFEGAVQLYARGNVGWISTDNIVVNKEWVSKWKVFTSMAYGGGGKFPNQTMGKPIIAAPNSACTETYLVLGLFNSKQEALNMAAYQQTRFFRFLVSLRKNTQHLSKDRFSFVPKLDMTKSWTDTELYQRYGLTPDEIAYIESMIKEMK